MDTSTAKTNSTIRRFWNLDNRVWEWNFNYTYLAICDFIQGIRRGALWVRLGWQDIILRYRRSLIGPFWLTISMGVMVFTLGLLYGTIFKMETREYLPYLTIGLLLWGFISGLITDGCQTFIEAEWVIRQADLPLSVFPLRVVWRNLLLFLHNVPIYLVVLFLLQVHVSWNILLVIPGLMIILANALWCTILFGMLSARFRDLPQIVSSLLQVAFFVTPIIWTVEQASTRRFFILGNPFYHIIEMLRKPMLGQAPLLVNWEISILMMVLGWIGTFLFYRRFHGRIAYWV